MTSLIPMLIIGVALTFLATGPASASEGVRTAQMEKPGRSEVVLADGGHFDWMASRSRELAGRRPAAPVRIGHGSWICGGSGAGAKPRCTAN